MTPQAIIFDYSGVLYTAEGLNQDLLILISSLLKGKYPLFILTASTSYRQPEIFSVLSKIFDQIFSTEDLGSKSDPETFRKLSAAVGIPVEGLLLIDDLSENIAAIQTAGGDGILFTDTQQLAQMLNSR